MSYKQLVESKKQNGALLNHTACEETEKQGRGDYFNSKDMTEILENENSIFISW